MTAISLPTQDPTLLPGVSVPLDVPHEGYHWDGSARRFFEGWYYRVSLPALGQGFAFMYSIEDPIGGQEHSGGVAQILGPEDQHQWRSYPQVHGFWAGAERLALGHWGQVEEGEPFRQPNYLDPSIFFDYVRSGYQATEHLNQGIFVDPIAGSEARWLYRIEPVYSYGIPARPTMGALSYLPVFEPGWQILMAHGLATGWIEWQGQRCRFERAPAYSEKNWGGAFPSKWFWLNCNDFSDVPDLALTCAGARRGVLWWQDEVAMISLHWQGRFLEWMPENSQIHWQVEPWGHWWVEADRGDYIVRLKGETERAGCPLLAPTLEGMQFACRDTLFGQITLQLWGKQGQVRSLELETRSWSGGLETGGGPWLEPWEGSC